MSGELLEAGAVLGRNPAGEQEWPRELAASAETTSGSSERPVLPT